LLEDVYEKCLMREMDLRGIPAQRQRAVPVVYRGVGIETAFRLDIYVDSCFIVEVKAVEAVLPIHKAQLMTYMRLMDCPLGLVLNFHEVVLKNGVHRMILPGADAEEVDF